MPELHERVFPVQEAGIKLKQAICEIAEKYELTYAELFALLGEQVMQWSKYAIREERHPGDPDRPGGLKGENKS